MATEAVMKSLSNAGSFNAEDYMQGFDDEWIEGVDDDWVWGKGARFGADDLGLGEFDPWQFGYNDDFDDGYAISMENPDGGSDDGGGVRRRRMVEFDDGLDVVFVGDSITEQRQGTMMGRDVANFEGIKEIFEKTFTKEKGGDFDGIAMGIAGDTVSDVFLHLK